MAYTKIFPIRRRLDYTIDYAVNPEKTAGGLAQSLDYITRTEKTERSLFVSALNCRADFAFDDMMSTKRRWNKVDRKNKGYHIIQSFMPGEVTPETAHAIGKELAERLLGEKYEVVISTHLDKGHLHNHIVFNSVSYTNGYMYRSTYDTLYNGIRAESDKLCREHGLSVITPKGRGMHYAAWKAEHTGQPNIRRDIRNDIDCIIPKSPTFKAFVQNMENAGYRLKYGPNVAHMAVFPPFGKGFIRLDSLKDPRYTEQGIKERITRQQETGVLEAGIPRAVKATPPVQPRYRLRGSFNKHKRVKLHGFKALYFRYLYMLGKIRKRQYPCKKGRPYQAELRKYNRYTSQYKFLMQHDIATDSQLYAYRDELRRRVSELSETRRPLYGERKRATDEETKSELSAKIAGYTAGLRQLRRELKQIRDIESDLAAIQEKMRQAETEKKEPVKEVRQYEPERRRSRSDR